MQREVAAAWRRSRACARTGRMPGALDRVDDLERVLDGQARRARTGTRRRVQKAALAASSLWRSIGRRLEYQREASSVCSRDGLLQRARITPRSASARVELDAHDRAVALHEPARPRALGERARRRISPAAVGAGARGWRGLAARRGRGPAGSWSRSPSGARPAAQRARRRRGRRSRSCASAAPVPGAGAVRARGRGSPRGGGRPSSLLTLPSRRLRAQPCGPADRWRRVQTA